MGLTKFLTHGAPLGRWNSAINTVESRFLEISDNLKPKVTAMYWQVFKGADKENEKLVQYSIECRKTKTQVVTLRNNLLVQLKLEGIILLHLTETHENLRDIVAIGFDFTFDW